jgi:hypothetical protein
MLIEKERAGNYVLEQRYPLPLSPDMPSWSSSPPVARDNDETADE